MKIGIVGQKWLGESVFKELSKDFKISFVAAPTDDDRLAVAARKVGILPVVHGANGLGGVMPTCRLDLLIAAHAFVHIPAELRASADWCIGYHPSLLPLHRGRNAVEAAVSAGDKVTGGTVFHLEEGFDTGGVAFQDWCFVDQDESAVDLWRRALAPIGVELLCKAAAHLSAFGFIPFSEQSKSR